MTRARELEFKLFSRVWIYSSLPDGSWDHRGNAKHSRKSGEEYSVCSELCPGLVKEV